MSDRAIYLENITYFYPNSKEPALEKITLSIDYGEFVVIAGPSGGGKSTLCRIIVGLIPYLYGGKLEGKVYVDGVDITTASIKDLIERVGVVLQNPENQIVNLVVEEEIAFPLENLLYSRSEIIFRVNEVLKKLSIEHLRDRTTYNLSGGEMQKVVLGSVLAVKPRILLLDEPLAHLDPSAALDLIEFLHYLNSVEGKTVIVIEHRVSELLRYATRLIVLNKRIVYNGDPRHAFNVLNDTISSTYGVETPSVARLGKVLGSPYVPLSIEEALHVIKPDALIHRLRKAGVGSDNDHHDCREVVIGVKDLWYIYENGIEALKGIDLDICKGELVAIVGGNGSGKTTLIKHFNGLLKPTKGKVFVLGKDTSMCSVAELAKHVGIVFQNPLHHFFRETVYDEVMFTARAMGIEKAEERVANILRKLGLAHLAKKSPYEISAGEQRRAAIASVLIYNPDIVVLDEPTAGIDFRLKLELIDILVNMWKEGKTVIITTHDMEFLAYLPIQKIIVLSKGRVVAIGGPRRIFYDVLSKKMYAFTPQIVKFVKEIGIDKIFKPLNIDELLMYVHGDVYGTSKKVL